MHMQGGNEGYSSAGTCPGEGTKRSSIMEVDDNNDEEDIFPPAPPPSPQQPRRRREQQPPSIAAAATAARGDLLTLPNIALKEYMVERGPLRAWVTLRRDKRFKYVRIADFLYEAVIEPHPELEKVVPGSGILTDLRDIIQEVRERAEKLSRGAGARSSTRSSAPRRAPALERPPSRADA
jgi:hypothetical protein